ncbi:MAG: OST-HTH/LOTUS domain-containing protein [Desulforhopalus sp.]|nr:OST-HTH/LOTUS domain-containing protein [Desulforhopalus sp.]
MSLEKSHQSAKDEVHRKIGRNMLMFQHMEQILKYMIAHGHIHGDVNTLEKNLKCRKDSVSRKTMGQLVGDFMENAHGEMIETEAPDESKVHMSFQFKVDCDEVYYDKRKKELAAIVAERNDLIHHLLPRFSLASIESCHEIEIYLDNQHEKLTREIEHIKSTLKSFDELRKRVVKYLTSDTWLGEVKLTELRQTRLVVWLGQIAEKAARSDGWAYLNTAGQVLQTQQPEELANIKKKYGYKSLKEIILAAELFDFMEEPTKKGGARVLYRLQEGWELSSSNNLLEGPK